MVGVRFTELQSRPMEFLDFTSLTLAEFQQLVPPLERPSNAIWRRGGWMGNSGPRVGLPCTTTAPSQAQDRLLFILTYVKTYTLQVVQGRLFGMVQSKANRWIHVLLPTLLAASRTLGMLLPAPSRPWHSASVSRRLPRYAWYLVLQSLLNLFELIAFLAGACNRKHRKRCDGHT